VGVELLLICAHADRHRNEAHYACSSLLMILNACIVCLFGVFSKKKASALLQACSRERTVVVSGGF